MHFIELIEYLNYYSASIVALATLILVFITVKYVLITNAILEEEQKTKKIREIKYRLENIYSPLDFILMNYRENRGLGMTLEDMIECQKKFSNDYMSLLCNYNYIMRIEITKYYNRIIEEYEVPIKELMFKNPNPEDTLKKELRADDKIFDSLNEHIEHFIYYVNHMINLYNKLLEENGIDIVNLNIEESDIEKFCLPSVKIIEY